MDRNSPSQAPASSAIEDIIDLRESSAWRRIASSQEFWITIAVFVIGAIVSVLAPNFATYTNLSNVLQNFCYIGILAIGMTPILISGGIDISIGAVLGLCGVVLGLLLEANWPLWAGILATLLLGAGLGAINGIFIAYLRLQPFLVTLGMLSIARSMALIVSRARWSTPSARRRRRSSQSAAAGHSACPTCFTPCSSARSSFISS